MKRHSGLLGLLILCTFALPACAMPGFFVPETGSEDEYLNVTGMFVPASLRKSHYVAGMDQNIATDALPSKWDWRKEGGVTSVKNQSKCSACYAFDTNAMIESHLLIRTGNEYDLSEEQVKNCIWQSKLSKQGGCYGGNTMWVINLLTHTGIVTEADYPYRPHYAGCNPDKEPKFRITDWDMLSTKAIPDTDILKYYIKNEGPLAVSTYVKGWNKPYNGSYVLGIGSDDEINHKHGVLLVGWNDSLGNNSVPGHWIFKNSWGAGWGDDGYGYIEYGTATTGSWASIITGYELYDPNVRTLHYDHAGHTDGLGCIGEEELQGMCIFDIGHEQIERVEFWTTGTTSDVDIYLYDGVSINNTRKANFGNMIYSVEDLSYINPGYHSVNIDVPVVSTTGKIVLVIKLKNENCIYDINEYPTVIAHDRISGAHSGKTYVAISDPSKPYYNDWYDMESIMPGISGKVAFRLRVNSDIGPNPGVVSIDTFALNTTDNLSVGDELPFYAMCWNLNVSLVDCGCLDWYSDNTTVGDMNGDIFNANYPGTTNITATNGILVSEPISVSVNNQKQSCQYITIDIQDLEYKLGINLLEMNEDLELVYFCYDHNDNKIDCGCPISWYVSNDTVGTMNETTFHAKLPGITDITAIGGLCTEPMSNILTIVVVEPIIDTKKSSGGGRLSSSEPPYIIPAPTDAPEPTEVSTPEFVVANFEPELICEANDTEVPEPNGIPGFGMLVALLVILINFRMKQ